MSDLTLNRYLARGTHAQRLAFTPSPPTPASGPDPGYVWYETDTGNAFAWDGSAWQQINIGSSSTGSTQTSFLVTGGQIAWIANYQFDVSAAVYYILGTQYSSPETTVTLGAADPTNDRIDVIAVDDSGAVVVVAGTPAAQPSEPDIDPGTQLKLGIVLVSAATTRPAGATSTLVYAEDAGAPTEWNWTTSGSGFNVASTNNPRSPSTKCIEGTAVTASSYAQGQIGSGTFDPSSANFLVLYLRSKATWNSKRGLTLTLRSVGVLVGQAININSSGTWGFDSSQTSSYQQIAIPLTAFAVPAGQTITQLRVTDFGGSIGFYLDDISFQSNFTTQTAGNGLTQDQADARYLQQANNLSDLASASTARTNLGLGALATKNTVATGDIDAAAVTLAKIANAAANAKVLGSGAAGSGSPYSELALGTGLQISGTTLSTVGGSSGSGNVTNTGAFGSEPGSPNTGDLYLPDNAGILERYAGAAWVGWGPLYPFTTPNNGAFSWVNQGGSSVATTNGGIYFLAPATTGTNWRLRVKTIGAKTRYELGFTPNLIGATPQAGLTLYESATGKLATMCVEAGTGIFSIQHWTNVTTFAGNDLVTQKWAPNWTIVWMAAQLSGANILYFVSMDGQTWIQVFSIAKTSQFTTGPDNWGLAINAGQTSYNTGVTILSVKES